MSEAEKKPRNFIEQEIDKDLSQGKYKEVVTRFSAGAERISAYRSCEV